MRTSQVQPSSEFRVPPQVNRMMGTLNSFLYAVPMLLVSFLALQASAFESMPKPPYKVTTPTLDGCNVSRSYEEYAWAFKEPLTKWVEDLNKEAPLSSNPYERTLENSLTIAPPGAFTPSRLSLDGALRNDLNNSFSKENTPYSLAAIRESPDLSRVAEKATKIVQKWHPADQVAISQFVFESSKLLTGAVSKYYRLESLPGHHIDDDYIATLTVPATEYPLQKGERWITTKGEEVLLRGIDHESNAVKVEDSLGETKTLAKEELHHHKCASGTTTPFVPGLVDGPSNEKFSLTGSLSSRVTHYAIDLINYSVSSTLNSSLLVPVSKLVHTGPFEKVDPNESLLKSCKHTFRKILFVFYELSCPAPPLFG